MKTIFCSILIFLSVCIQACKTVAVTGRKQLNLVPNALIQSLAFAQYDSVVKKVTHYIRAMKGRKWLKELEVSYSLQ